jgi:methionine sulfoxide reductase heme-binding subunit
VRFVATSVTTGRQANGAARQRQAFRARAARSAVTVAALGVASMLPFNMVIYHLQAQGRSAAAVAMGSMHMDRMSQFWAFPILQASGIAALIWAYAGVLLGLLESGTKPAWWPWRRERTDRIHRQISLLVIGLILVHAVATAYDAMGDGWMAAFVPWQQSWGAAVLGYNTGIFALYLAVLVGPTYYLRRRIGPVRWRFVHRFALVVYILSVWHTLLLGVDFSYYPWVRPLTWVAQIPLLALFIRRLARPARRGEGTARAWTSAIRYALIAASAAAVAAIVALVVTGHADLPHRVGYHTPMPMPSGSSWLPVWLRVVATAALVVVAAVHLWHLSGQAARGRLWHTGHVVMALGMIDMFWPTGRMPVGGGIGQGVFAVAALGALGLAVADLARRRPGRWLWVLAVVDLGSMIYMFALPIPGLGWLTWILVAWFVLQAAGWASGRLTPIGRPSHPDNTPAPPALDGEPLTGDTTAASQPAGTLVTAVRTAVSAAPDGRRRHELSVRLTLLVMNVGMAYMFLAMRLGMQHMGGAMPSMPGMGGMPGM